MYVHLVSEYDTAKTCSSVILHVRPVSEYDTTKTCSSVILNVRLASEYDTTKTCSCVILHVRLVSEYPTSTACKYTKECTAGAICDPKTKRCKCDPPAKPNGNKCGTSLCLCVSVSV